VSAARTQTLLAYIEDQLSVQGKLPPIPVHYSKHALTRFMQRHASVSESRPTNITVTKDNILGIHQEDNPDEVILKVSVPLYKEGEEVPSYYLAFLLAVKETPKGELRATVITTYPYNRVQHLVKSLGWGRRAARGKLSFKSPKSAKKKRDKKGRKN